MNSVPAAQSTNEDTALVFSAGNSNLVSISDVDAGAATVQTQLTVTNGTLSLSGVAGLTFVGGANGTATMTVQGTIAAINTAMAGMSYAPTANYNGPATLTILTSDLGNTGAGGPLTDTDTVNITVNAVNDAPVNSVPAAQSTNEDTALVFSAGNRIVSISDVDAGAATVQTQLTVTNGTLSLSGVAGLTFVGGANGTATMTVQGTIAAINTAMAGMSYAPTANYNGPATLTILTSDLGNTGAGGPLTDTDTVNITVNAVNDAPVNSVPAAQSTNEDTALVFSAGNSNLVSISDVDAGAATVQTQLTVTNGTLSLSGVAGLTFVGGANGTATMTVQGTIAAINTAMAGMSYAPTANYNGPATLTILTSDLGNTGAGGPLTDTDTVNITVNAIDDAPVNSVPAAQSTNEDTALVFSAGNSNLVSISDVDAGAATVQTQLTVTNGTLSLSGVAGLTFVGGANGTATMTVQGTIGRDQHRHGRHELRPHGQLQRPGHPHHPHQRPGQHRRRRPAHRHRHGQHHRQRGQRCAGEQRPRGAVDQRGYGAGLLGRQLEPRLDQRCGRRRGHRADPAHRHQRHLEPVRGRRPHLRRRGQRHRHDDRAGHDRPRSTPPWPA